MRLLLSRLALFLLPFALYYAYWLASRDVPRRRLTPWTALIVAGLVLVAGSFVWLGLTEGDSTAGKYVPAHVVDGRVVPGHVEKTP
jgi:hypothetical protein